MPELPQRQTGSPVYRLPWAAGNTLALLRWRGTSGAARRGRC